jgi:hypothetical protein
VATKFLDQHNCRRYLGSIQRMHEDFRQWRKRSHRLMADVSLVGTKVTPLKF